jgi:hypothetical protein
MENQLKDPRKVSFRLKAHDSQSLVAILWSMYSLFIETWKGDQTDDAKKWLPLIKDRIAAFCAIAHDQDGSEFWRRFRDVAVGFRALEGALNDSGNGFEAKVNFDLPDHHTFNLIVRDLRTGRFFEATFRPKHFETVDLNCCVFANPIDKIDSLLGEAEHLRDSAHHVGSVINVEVLELEDGCHANAVAI